MSGKAWVVEAIVTLCQAALRLVAQPDSDPHLCSKLEACLILSFRVFSIYGLL
jgi:hypothetical protein